VYFLSSSDLLHVFHAKMSERRAEEEAKMAGLVKEKKERVAAGGRSKAIQSDESLWNDTRDVQNHSCC